MEIIASLFKKLNFLESWENSIYGNDYEQLIQPWKYKNKLKYLYIFNMNSLLIY